MRPSSVFRSFLVSLSFFLFNLSSSWSAPSYNEVALDVPFDGGGTVMLSRMWKLARYVDVGVMLGGGQVSNEFDLETNLSREELKAETKATVFPFFGPRVSINGSYFGVSIGYGLFYAKTDFEVETPVGKIKGDEAGWGSAFYAPLLVLDFYNKKYDMIFGFGLAGFWGTNYKDLVAEGNGLRITTDESPLNSLTFHVRSRWSTKRGDKAEYEDPF